MTLQELHTHTLQLSTDDRWQLVQTFLEALRREANPKFKQGNLSRLQGIAKTSAAPAEGNTEEEVVTYWAEK